MRKFEIPSYYRSSFVSTIKKLRKDSDPRKKDFTPTILNFGPVQFLIARHFGFCYGVENAIEIAYKAVDENPKKRIFLLSQMIHNPIVNKDLQEKGIKFIMDTEGNQLIDWDVLTVEDIIIIPAFGTTLEIEERLKDIGLNPQQHDTTCPFVEKVWKASEKLGKNNHTIIIHGKFNHEETRATFSHSDYNGKSLIIKDIQEAQFLEDVILGKESHEEFFRVFKNRHSANFNISKDLTKIGVINQTTMLATETQEIADFLKNSMIKKYGMNNYNNHFADTRDTLCYATNDNQQATLGILKENADLAIVVGGYNSSNTSHIVELCEQKLPTYYINSSNEIENSSIINHYNFHKKIKLKTTPFLPNKNVTRIILTSGASCPDTLVDEVLDILLSYFPNAKSKEEVVTQLI